MAYADVNDCRMYYEEHGAGDPLVLLHGGPGAIESHASGWGRLLPTLAEHYRAIPVEHRGHGRTNNPAGRLSYAQIAADVAVFIEGLVAGPVHLAGVSDGAVVALVLGTPGQTCSARLSASALSTASTTRSEKPSESLTPRELGARRRSGPRNWRHTKTRIIIRPTDATG